MGFETAVIISYLGISFILAYIGSKLSDENFIFVGIKTFLYAASIVLLISMFSFNISLIDYANETSTNGLSSSTYGNLTTNINNGFVHLMIIERIIMTLAFFVLIWWMYSFLQELIKKGKKKKEGGFEDIEKF